MVAGMLKASPFAAALGAISAKDALAYAGIVSLLSTVLVVGALWGAAKAWRERAEARSDEADQREEDAVRAEERAAIAEANLAEQAIVTAGQINTLQHEVATLQGRTDVVLAMAPILEWTHLHEKRAQERHEAQMAASAAQNDAVLRLLELIAARLGPEPEGDTA